MAKPSYTIWKNKPQLNAYGQYVQVGVADYYSIGFDNDDPDDDLYTNFTNVGRGTDSGPDQSSYFDADSLDLNDHIYGVGQFRIEKITIDLDSSITGDENQNHNQSDFHFHFIDSAAFYCQNGDEPGCEVGPNQEGPTHDVHPLTGDYIASTSDLWDRWYLDGNAFRKNRRFYRFKAQDRFDCDWFGYDEFEPNDTFQIVGEKITDTADNQSLNYWPNSEGNGGARGATPGTDIPAADSDLWRWKFFPYINNSRVKAVDGYNYTNGYFPLVEGAMDWDDFVKADSFSNITDVDWGGDTNNRQAFDYNGAFYLMFRGSGYRCDNTNNDNHRTIPSMTIITIPKKHIFDNWNGYKPICFTYGTTHACEPGDIVFPFDKPTTIEQPSSGAPRTYHFYNMDDTRIRIIPPRVFYQNDSDANHFRPVNNSNSSNHMKNPIDKDPVNRYFNQLTNCIFTNEPVGEDQSCLYPAFYPYVSEVTPYLYSPTNDVDFTGNLIGITDGTSGTNRTDNVETEYTTNSNININNITLNTEYIREREFTPIAYSWIGNTDVDDPLGLTVQRRYKPNSIEEAQTSSPNFVNFWISPSYGNASNGPVDDQLFNLADELWNDDIYLDTGMGYKWAIARWGDEEDASTIDASELISELEFWSSSPTSYYQETTQTGRYDWADIKNNNGLGIFSHQYQSQGPKEIKAFVFSYIKNTDQSNTFNRIFEDDGIIPFQTIHWKLITIRINMNMSEVLVEDFSEIGGNDFTYIPMNVVSPMIGGMHKNSNYVKTSQKIYSSNLFHPTEVLDKIRTKKAVENDNMGYWPGKMDLEQIRLFNFPFDINYLLGIGNKLAVTSNRFRPHDYKFYWDGIENSFSTETSVGEIFIDDNIDVNLKSSCILELNTSTLFGNKILDSSGNGNIGILIGDYSLRKNDKLEPVVREQSMKTPVVGDKDGAI